MGKKAYFDVTFGASGDMILASFIDLGMPIEHLVATLKCLDLPEFTIKTRAVTKNGMSALKLDIDCPKGHTHRNFSTIRDSISNSSLKDGIKVFGLKMFALLADAEAHAHGTDRDEITFHEIGALDSIIDIVGIATALDYFKITSASCSAIPLCGGSVKCEHGNIPAMSPAAGILLKGLAFYMSDVNDELITPTGAAALKMLTSDETASNKGFAYDRIGSGAGSKEFETHPNIMRIFLGDEATGKSDEAEVSVIETNIDDMNPQLFDSLFDGLFGCKGVLDAFTMPVMMKKGRPGFLLKVIIKKPYLEEISNIIFRNSTTIGLRHYDVGRVTLERAIERLSTAHGEFSVKVASLKGKTINVSCEYDECKAAALRLNLSVKDVQKHVNAKIEEKYFKDEK